MGPSCRLRETQPGIGPQQRKRAGAQKAFVLICYALILMYYFVSVNAINELGLFCNDHI
jgi:hypothetical protein